MGSASRMAVWSRALNKHLPLSAASARAMWFQAGRAPQPPSPSSPAAVLSAAPAQHTRKANQPGCTGTAVVGALATFPQAGQQPQCKSPRPAGCPAAAESAAPAAAALAAAATTRQRGRAGAAPAAMCRRLCRTSARRQQPGVSCCHGEESGAPARARAAARTCKRKHGLHAGAAATTPHTPHARPTTPSLPPWPQPPWTRPTSSTPSSCR